MSIVVAHPGTQHAPHLVRGLFNAGEKVEYHTIMTYGEGYDKPFFLTDSLYRKRKVTGIPDSVIHRQSMLEFIPAFYKKLRFSDTLGYAARNKMFQEGISSRTIRNSSAIIGFDTSSFYLETKARKSGIPFFLELTTPHPLEKQKWTEYLSDNFSEWPVDVLTKPKSLIEQEEMEVDLATVVSVPSSYVQKSHEPFLRSQKKFVVNPFGADLSTFYPKSGYNQRPRFIFLGAINAAKGLPVLLKAWELLSPDAELIVGGRGELPRGVRLPENVTMAGPVSKEDRIQFFHSGDVLVCPSLYEGLAIVQLEAAACGLSVIGTYNSGGSEFLKHGEEALFVEPGNVEALASAINTLCSDSLVREKMGRNAASKARQYSWDAYVNRWLSVISANKIIAP